MPVVPEREVCKFIAGVTSLVAKQGALLELKLQRLNRTLTVLVYKRMPDIHNKHLDKNKPRMFVAETANQTVSKWLQVRKSMEKSATTVTVLVRACRTDA